MIVLEDVVGDESDEYLSVEYINQNLRSSIYELLVANKGKDNKDMLGLINEEVKGIFKTIITEVKDPQIQCTLKGDGVMNITFLAPMWFVEKMGE